jgi:hypothetical protein
MIHETGKLHKRQIKINYKTQFLINLVLKDKIKKKNTKNYSSQPTKLMTIIMRPR